MKHVKKTTHTWRYQRPDGTHCRLLVCEGGGRWQVPSYDGPDRWEDIEELHDLLACLVIEHASAIEPALDHQCLEQS
jgi:hypothetical protein